MYREDRAYSYASKVTRTLFDKGFKDSSKDKTKAPIFGALAGTALSALIINLSSNKLVKEIAGYKSQLDETYNPMQRHLAEEIEKLNSSLVKSRIVGNTTGFVIGGTIKGLTNNALANGVIGEFVSNQLVDALTLKKKAHLEELLDEYIPTLDKDQIKIRAKLDLASRKLGVRWSLGIVGGALVGAFIGRATDEAIKEYKIEKLNKTNK